MTFHLELKLKFLSGALLRGGSTEHSLLHRR